MKVDLEMMELFDELESIITNASTIPFSHKCGVDKEEVLSIINDIKALIPEEVTQAVWINKERHKIINSAKQEAAELIEQAKKEAKRIHEEYSKDVEALKQNSEEVVKAYVEASEPVIKAEEKAKEIVERAERIATEIRLGSIDYAEDVLLSVEHNLKGILDEVSRDRAQLNPDR
ncbi:hypothetical protein CHF27_001295 [Romboutsia maritimum]|uniref:ATPase n=1 Tax=Romboutsia maritimum TaxID=2020948 RepID=A0A371IWL1_9FIRM|nr:hypothetical protein [Romboutsia maritimum]RDY24862.1 hypothetical protein CHF27_001295 [Romboutsia maritimum]